MCKDAVALDKQISKERGLPKVFTGKTPINSASASLTNNSERYFVSFRPPQATSLHFKLAYEPGNHASAWKNYQDWLKTLIQQDWPKCFGTDTAESTSIQTKTKETLPSIVKDAADLPLTVSETSTLSSFHSESELLLPELPTYSTDPEYWTSELFSSQDDYYFKPDSDGNIFNLISSADDGHDLLDDEDANPSDSLPETFIPTSLQDVVHVGVSSIPNAGRGVFAKRDLPKNIPIGFYYGGKAVPHSLDSTNFSVPMSEDEFDSIKEGVGMASIYTIMYAKTVLDATDDQGQPYTDPAGAIYCPYHFLNEREKDSNNVAFLRGREVNQVIIWTIKDIKQGDELTVHYGREVDRSTWSRETTATTDESIQTPPPLVGITSRTK